MNPTSMHNNKVVLLSIAIAVVILLIGALGLYLFNNSTNKNSSNIQPTPSETLTTVTYDSFQDNTLVQNASITVKGKISKMEGSTITLSDQNDSMTFAASSKTAFEVVSNKIDPVKKTQSGFIRAYPQFKVSDVKTGDNVEVIFKIGTSNGIFEAEKIRLLQ